MGKLHEILAVEGSKLQTARNVIDEAKKTFSTRQHLLQGLTTRQESKLTKEDSKYNEFPDTTEVKPIAETVPGKLDFVAQMVSEWYDIVAQKDEANTIARADLIIDNNVLIANLPSVTLLFIENKLKDIRDMLSNLPVLDTAKVWRNTNTPYIYETDLGSKVVKEVVEKIQVVVPPTDKHPAQVAKITEQEVRAIKYTTETSGFVSTHQKYLYLKRCDELIQAAKEARQRANDITISVKKVGKTLFDYILKH